MTMVLDKKKLMEQSLFADIELLIHAFMHAEFQQFERVSENLPRDVSYLTLRAALASDVVETVRRHDFIHNRK